MKNNGQSFMLKEKISIFKQQLTNDIENCNQVFLISHNKPDYDSLASLGAAALICKKLKKAPYIIIDDKEDNLSDDVCEMISKIKEKFIVINTNDYEKNKTNNDLLIMVDVNKGFMTALEGKQKQFKNIIIIDHHAEDENTVRAKNKFISLEVSSCSEIMSFLIKQYKIIPSDSNYYTYLLAGIYLDTNKLSKNKFISTLECVANLISNGADQSKADDFFSLDYESDRRVQGLVDKSIPVNINILFSYSEQGSYTQEEIAKAADYALNYKCDASIVVARMQDERFGVSARSKGKVGVNNIMHILNGGGGNLFSASCTPIYVDEDSVDLEKKIVDILTFNKI